MAKEEIGANSVFTGPQKGLTVIGNHCYAFSGSVGVNNSDVEMLSFTTGKDYIVAKITMGSKAGNADDMKFWININGNLIYSGYEALVSMPTQQYLNILIPPNSFVELYARNIGSATNRDMECVLVGKVYEE